MTLVARRSLGREPGREAEIQWETYRDWTEGQLSALLEEQCGRLVPADKEAERAAAFRFSKIAKQREAVLFLVGDGELRSQIQEDVLHSDRKGIFFLGERSDIPQLLHFFYIMIFPSLYE